MECNFPNNIREQYHVNNENSFMIVWYWALEENP